MSTPTSSNLHIICPVANRTLVNDTLRYVDPTSDGGDPINSPLTTTGAPATVAAVGGTWAMTDTTNQQLRAAVQNAGWNPRPSRAEQTIYLLGDAVPTFTSGQRMWLFQAPHPWDPTVVVAGSMTFEQALAVLGLQPYTHPRV